MKYFAHESSVIDEGALIGDSTKIWHWTHVCSGAVIGKFCSLGQNVFVGGNAILGDNVKIQNNVSIYDNVSLENDVFCGPSVVFTNVYNPRSEIPRKDEYLDTMVRKGATLGANCTIICGVEIGKYAFIGAGSVVTKNVRDFALVVGNPAKQIGWMSEYGKKLSLPVKGTYDKLYAECPLSNEKYQLIKGQLIKC
jgi:UDP-2-acetamido-3-amino-2,3-dideoxy-glucuronate N-acetyltransferase